jgi:hypothetical protein
MAKFGKLLLALNKRPVPPPPNVFCYHDRSASPFWKKFMWVAQAAKMGYKWHVGDGKSVRFWEDQWFGSYSLAIQY